MMKTTSFPARAIVTFSVLCLNLALVSCQTKSSVSKAPPVNQPLPVQRIQNGVQLNTAALNVKVQFYAGDIIRVIKWLPGGTSEKSSLVVIQTNVPALNIQFSENADMVTLASEKVTVQLSKSSGAIQYLTAGGQPILKEQGAPVITPAPIAHDEKAFSVQQNFKLTPDEGIYGLGQHQSGYMNYRGHCFSLG